MKKGFLRFAFVIALFSIFLPIKVSALTFKVEKSVDTAKPGSEVTVYVKASDVTEDSIQGYSINLSYDTTKLEYKSSNSEVSDIGVNGNPIIITKKASGAPISTNTTLAAIVFGVKNNAKSGDCNLTIDSSGVVLISGKTANATNTSSMVKIVSLSNDATLSSLKIPNTTLNPKFDKNTLEYTTTITDITELTVNAVASNSGSKIMISDNYKNLVKGDNDIKIVVTAEDGTKKTYTINITKSEGKGENTESVQEQYSGDGLASLEIEKLELSPKFDTTIHEYTVKYIGEKDKLDINVTTTDPYYTTEITGNEELKEGENIINILVSDPDGKNVATYQITVNKSLVDEKALADEKQKDY